MWVLDKNKNHVMNTETGETIEIIKAFGMFGNEWELYFMTRDNTNMFILNIETGKLYREYN